MKPLSDKVSQRGFVIAEVGFILGLLMIIVTGKTTCDYFNHVRLGWIAMATVIGGIVACWVNFFVQLIPEIIDKLKQKCKKAPKKSKRKAVNIH